MELTTCRDNYDNTRFKKTTHLQLSLKNELYDILNIPVDFKNNNNIFINIF